jgi:glycosyltransferase involved in cell wall biosynthesis
VNRTIRELGLQERIIWTDFMPQAEVSAHLKASDVCALPFRDGASFRRGTLMAALANGMAIVTTAETRLPPRREAAPGGTLPGSRPDLRDGENVLLVPPDDPHALAGAIKRAAGSPDLRAKLEKGALALAAFFTWDKIADAHVELYAQLVAARS